MHNRQTSEQNAEKAINDILALEAAEHEAPQVMEPWPAFGTAERSALIEECVQALAKSSVNETAAWNLWNALASDSGAIRRALLGAWRIAPQAEASGAPTTAADAAAQTALARVREIHRESGEQVDDEGAPYTFCLHCTDVSHAGQVRFPCATRAAIDGVSEPEWEFTWSHNGVPQLYVWDGYTSEPVAESTHYRRPAGPWIRMDGASE